MKKRSVKGQRPPYCEGECCLSEFLQACLPSQLFQMHNSQICIKDESASFQEFITEDRCFGSVQPKGHICRDAS
jgi:hypothetical protein